jgi:hypothetical protein
VFQPDVGKLPGCNGMKPFPVQMPILIFVLKTEGLAFPAITATCFCKCSDRYNNHELPSNYVRINAWDGFLKRDMIEVVCGRSQMASLFRCLGWKYQAGSRYSGHDRSKGDCDDH